MGKSRAINHWKLRRLASTPSVQSIEAAINDYFLSKVEQDKPPTMAGLRNSLGLTRLHFQDLCFHPQYSQILQSAVSYVEEYVESGLLDGSVKSQAAALYLSNYFGWTTNPTKAIEADELSKLSSSELLTLLKDKQTTKDIQTE